MGKRKFYIQSATDWMFVLSHPITPLEIKSVNPKGNQSWIFIRRTDAEAEVQHFGHLMQRANSLEKTLMLGKIEGRRRRGPQRMRWLDVITDIKEWVWANSGRQWRTRKTGVLQSMGSQSQIRLCKWTTHPTQTSHTEALTPNVIIFRGGAFERQLGLDEVMRVGSSWWDYWL